MAAVPSSVSSTRKQKQNQKHEKEVMAYWHVKGAQAVICAHQDNRDMLGEGFVM